MYCIVIYQILTPILDQVFLNTIYCKLSQNYWLIHLFVFTCDFFFFLPKSDSFSRWLLVRKWFIWLLINELVKLSIVLSFITNRPNSIYIRVITDRSGKLNADNVYYPSTECTSWDFYIIWGKSKQFTPLNSLGGCGWVFLLR